jgi:hypothetical protein
MDSKAQAIRQPISSLQQVIGTTSPDFDFDLWAVAVRQQMLAALKRKEGSRSNWGRTQA